MVVTVRLFAIWRELAQTDSIEIDYDQNLTIDHVLNQLADRLPCLIEVIEQTRAGSVLVSRNLEYVGGFDESVCDGDEIALIPPVSGG